MRTFPFGDASTEASGGSASRPHSRPQTPPTEADRTPPHLYYAQESVAYTPTPSRRHSKGNAPVVRGHHDHREDPEAKASAAARAKALIEAAAAEHPGWSTVSAQIEEQERSKARQAHAPQPRTAPRVEPQQAYAKAVALHNLPPYQAVALYAARARAHQRALTHHAPPQNLKQLHSIVGREWDKQRQSGDAGQEQQQHWSAEYQAQLTQQAMLAAAAQAGLLQDDYLDYPVHEGTPRLPPGAVLGWDPARYEPPRPAPGLENAHPSNTYPSARSTPGKPLPEDASGEFGQFESPLLMGDGLGPDLRFLDESPKADRRGPLRPLVEDPTEVRPLAPEMPPPPRFPTRA